MHKYDVIIIGAGSVGVPLAWALGKEKVKALVVDQMPSPGQGENKHAIGGIRATHSAPGKIMVGLRSLEIFSSWKDQYGDTIEWQKGGYLFPVYREEDETFFKNIMPVQKEFGLNIDFIDPSAFKSIVPGINSDGLIGGAYSPDDGSASPLLSINAFYKNAVENKIDFQFNCCVKAILTDKNKVVGVSTTKGIFHAPVVVDVAGAYSKPLCQPLGVDLPVIPESHEGAITEPVESFFKCMVVDIRPDEGSKNYYFYQNLFGQIVFCITPDPPIIGSDKRETSIFLPQVGKRMIYLLPRLKNIRVRRVWRGLYPMTPDGSPLVGWNDKIDGLLHATGMCGQGFMLGPGLGEVVMRMITHSLNENDSVILKEFSLSRVFGGQEALK